jgi:hypothetical protein
VALVAVAVQAEAVQEVMVFQDRVITAVQEALVLAVAVVAQVAVGVMVVVAVEVVAALQLTRILLGQQQPQLV